MVSRGKRIRMDEIPMEYSHYMTENLQDDPEAGEGSGQRMTRLRARGGVPTKPPIIDEDDEDIFMTGRKRKIPKPPKEKVEREPKPPRVRKEREVVEREPAEEKIVKEREITTDENSLFWILRYSKNTITTIVDEWIENYKVDRDSALISLMQFFINASGCKGKITPEMQVSMEHTSIIRKMTEEFDEESGEYPLIMAGQQWKKFKTHFCEFVQTLVKQCQYSIIYDQFLMDNIISLLTGLSDSQVRAFRHTATLAAMKLMTALVDVALLVSINQDNAARQYEGERLKGAHDVSEERLESLMAKRQELEENMDEIKNMLTYLFKSVFVHRYRDTLPDIRAICMIEIGIWMHKFSSNFLDDSYLKYIGWTLHDKVGEVRLRCLQALLPLYENEELKGKLELFTSKFKDRIVAMTLDKEYEVAVHAVKLVIKILKIHQDILTDKDCEIVYELVYSSHRGVAQAAAEFLNVRLFFIDPSVDSYTKRGKKRLPNTPLIRDLVQFFIESELHEHGAYLVDSFIESNPMIKDWECMTDLLLEESGPGEEAMDIKQESTLIEIMVSAVKQVALAEPPIGRGSNRQKTLTAKETKQVQDDKQKLTEHFIQTLPYLLEKYSADNEKLINLLSIPQYFDLEMYTTLRQEASLKFLLDKITHIIAINTDREVLEACAKTIEFLCTEGSAIYTQCDVARSNIIDESVNRYKEAIDDWRNLIAGEEVPDEDEIHQVCISLKKVSILYSCHNLNPWNLFTSLFQDIEEYFNDTAHEKSIPIEALIYCIESCFFSISWGIASLESSFESSALAFAAEELRRNLDKYMTACNHLIRSGDLPIKEAAYISICDLLVICSANLGKNSNRYVQMMEYRPTDEQKDLLINFVKTYVFSSRYDEVQDETRIEELHKKRSHLAAYCKLVVYNILPTTAACDIFKYYIKFYNDYGDIIKTTLGKTRENSKTNCTMTMCMSLKTAFEELQNFAAPDKISRSSQEFSDLKELAKRFALSFGLDAIKNREVVTALHRAGILFATQNHSPDDPNPPQNILFLEVLNEFTNKLLKQDKKVVLNFLDRRIAMTNMPSSNSDDWQPLLNYRNSLLHGESDQAATPVVVNKKVYTRKGKKSQAGEEEGDD